MNLKKTTIKIASKLLPNLITSFAYNQLTNPQVRKLRKNELGTLDKSKKERFKFNDSEIQLYTWSGGKKEVLLIHGWEGQAGNFSDLIELLISDGYTVRAFDAPSHGYSSRGSTSLFEFSDLVGVLIKKYNIKSIVSHSFGGVATTYALFRNPDLRIEKYVLITTPDKFIERINDVAEMIGIDERVKNRLISRLNRETGRDVKALNVSDFVKKINVEKSLIIHDKNDKVIPIERSLNVHQNWAASEFDIVEGTGHFRILRTKAILDKVLSYLN